ncbi:hypothetical protein GSI_02595 [Ganoderma sinense ZZ0214-1]|uniref:Protein kinase domain-containing protein n=1 Tax=Ganoderma sinense ZZ0214-1 TaxID=1077348 RepID=A0A2G8SMK5_9APHY|nr:hypothetical protein GSI_02595 [Ganoderma sinense ZZ0214-1]
MATTAASGAEPVPASVVTPKPVASMAKIPDWLLTHPELHKRGIVVHRPVQPFTVYETEWQPEGPIYVVKGINPSRPEADIYDLLDRYSDSPADHTIPHEVIRCERPLLVMPFVGFIEYAITYKTSSMLAVFGQILEGVEHMHWLRIAHGDIYAPNVVAASEDDAKRDARLTAGRVYLIDFETSRQFEHGPGVQTAVPLPNTHVIPPLDMKVFDPFSWDVYCLGKTLDIMVQRVFGSESTAKPWIVGCFARWLKGNEVGSSMPSLLDVPDWLKDHPDLLARDIKLFMALKPYGGPYYTARPRGSTIPQYVVKVLDPATEEGAISERLQDHPSSPNHGIPSEIIPSEPRLLVMPFVGSLSLLDYIGRPNSFFLDLFHQIIEGVEYLHRLQIAHLDICIGNVLYAFPYEAATDPRIVAGKVYFIDFHTSRQLALEPGRQPPILLPPSQLEKPAGVTSLDPYSFDVYCAGTLMLRLVEVGGMYD